MPWWQSDRFLKVSLFWTVKSECLVNSNRLQLNIEWKDSETLLLRCFENNLGKRIQNIHHNISVATQCKTKIQSILRDMKYLCSNSARDDEIYRCSLCIVRFWINKQYIVQIFCLFPGTWFWRILNTAHYRTHMLLKDRRQWFTFILRGNWPLLATLRVTSLIFVPSGFEESCSYVVLKLWYLNGIFNDSCGLINTSG